MCHVFGPHLIIQISLKRGGENGFRPLPLGQCLKKGLDSICAAAVKKRRQFFPQS